jgi:hypothetical protein
MWTCPSYAWLLVLLILCTSGSAAETPSGFSPEAWRKAADPQSDTWSREPLLRQFAGSADISAMSRAEIIHWLGEPGVTQQIYDPGEGPRGRIDFYRLSAKNDHSFRIDYDAKDKVSVNFIEASPCTCELCELARAHAGSVRMEALEGSLLKAPEGLRSITMSELERRVAVSRAATHGGSQDWRPHVGHLQRTMARHRQTAWLFHRHGNSSTNRAKRVRSGSGGEFCPHRGVA